MLGRKYTSVSIVFTKFQKHLVSNRRKIKSLIFYFGYSQQSTKVPLETPNARKLIDQHVCLVKKELMIAAAKFF